MNNNIFLDKKTIAIIGLSDKPDRESYQVAEYLQSKGFTVIPINPHAQEILGEKAYPDLLSLPSEIHVDIVDIFRKPAYVIPHLQEVIKRNNGSTVWLQEGVGSQEAIDYATQHRIPLVSNMCIMKTHKKVHQTQQ